MKYFIAFVIFINIAVLADLYSRTDEIKTNHEYVFLDDGGVTDSEGKITLVSCGLYCKKHHGEGWWCRGLYVNEDNTANNICSNDKILITPREKDVSTNRE